MQSLTQTNPSLWSMWSLAMLCLRSSAIAGSSFGDRGAVGYDVAEKSSRFVG